MLQVVPIQELESVSIFHSIQWVFKRETRKIIRFCKRFSCSFFMVLTYSYILQQLKPENILRPALFLFFQYDMNVCNVRCFVFLTFKWRLQQRHSDRSQLWLFYLALSWKKKKTREFSRIIQGAINGRLTLKKGAPLKLQYVIHNKSRVSQQMLVYMCMVIMLRLPVPPSAISSPPISCISCTARDFFFADQPEDKC